MSTLRAACACSIDVHAHVVPEHLPAWLGSGAAPALWPSMADAPPAGGLCHRHVLVGARHYRTVNEKSWSVPRRLADLPDMGLAQQVLSPMPELLSYWLPAAAAQPLLRYLNETIATMVAESGGALLGLGVVPLQDIDLAIAELRHVMALGLRGVEIGSNVEGTPLGDMRLDPFFAACAALGAAVFVHALKPAGMDRLVGPPALEQVLAYPTDVGLAAASAITGNLLQRHPTLRIAFSHGGGTLASLLPRLEQGCKTFPALREQVQSAPSQQARQFFYDTLVYDAPTLRHLAAIFGTSQLMLGTDYPFNFHEPRPAQRVAEAGFDGAVADALLHINARRFLGLDGAGIDVPALAAKAVAANDGAAAY